MRSSLDDCTSAFIREKNTYVILCCRGSVTFLSEFDEEMTSTRKILERVPEGKFGWKSHEKSPHSAAILMHGRGWKPADATSKVDLLAAFYRYVAVCREALAAESEDLDRAIPVQPGVTKPLGDIWRRRIMNHLIHHRGQLSVYLRLLDVAAPGMYGASADDKLPDEKPTDQ